MAESRTVRTDCSGQTERGRSAKIMARQVLDARRSRDCLEDLQVFFNEDDQALIQSCASIQAVDARVEDVSFGIQPVPLNNGCFTVDCNFTILVRCNVFMVGSEEPIELTGRTSFLKRCILFGGCGGVQTFSSDSTSSQDIPVATVQVSQPVVLQLFITDCPDKINVQPGVDNTTSKRLVFATIGVFSVISLERNIQLTIPVLRAGAPPRQCTIGEFTEDPCQLFRRAAFPANKFCP